MREILGRPRGGHSPLLPVCVGGGGGGISTDTLIAFSAISLAALSLSALPLLRLVSLREILGRPREGMVLLRDRAEVGISPSRSEMTKVKV